MDFNNFGPPGIKFHPNDQEIIEFYVSNKNFNTHHLQPNLISDVMNLYDFHPQQLTDRYSPMNENEWYFYYEKDSSFLSQNNKRSNREGKNGTWLGDPKKPILNQQNIEIGFKRSLEFVESDEKLTQWNMIEYHLLESNNIQQCNWMLCKIYKTKSREMKTFTNEDKESNIKRQKLVQEEPTLESELNLYCNSFEDVEVGQESLPNSSTELKKDDEFETISAKFENLFRIN
ncbi:hypothetical protein F8388_017861 [Cannabis sativa]|uniref:NAC domain-containing protein n=1 Tax=Cannabis sativa TaxID=3483 RepID=A0A7J6EG76_CANSA|nr:hypothetical protein G4B88_009711 [Cannabis sativa]KAF4365295.1 hypothetical protein F8388_017861 [Cannabis sativa]